MTLRDQIQEFINEYHFRIGFTPNYDYEPVLGFKLTNVDCESSNLFKVGSLKEAEDLVISFISTAKRGEIFTNDVYDENKELFIKVFVVFRS